jgi:integrase
VKAPLKTNSEYEALMASLNDRRDTAKWRLMVQLSFQLGLRPIELAQLDTSHFRSGELRIRIGHTKGRGGRSLPVSDAIMTALSEHMRGREGQVFRNERGEPMTGPAVSSAMRRLYREAGQVGSCYSGRRTAGQRMQDAGANILTLQGFYGHKSPLTTMSYVGVSMNQLRAAMFA